MRGADHQLHERRSTLRFCCALLMLLICAAIAGGQDFVMESDLLPHQALPADAQQWNEPSVYVPVMPLDLPPIRQAEYQRRIERPTMHEFAPVLHQEPLPRPETPPTPIMGAEPLEPIAADQVWPTPSCLGCGGCGGCGSGGCGGCQNCEPCEAHTRLGRFACGIYHSICCPDPCYEPAWTGIANASFWVESARPVTQTRYRWDTSRNLMFPDRAEFIWPAVGLLGPPVAPNTINLNELNMYTEIATGGFSIFFETPYRSYETNLGAHAAGFSDMTIGTKSMLFDCDLMQITLQFKTFLPVGVGFSGLGTQHVSLEPSLLMALNLAPDTYAQAQISEWIPISADANAAGAILHYHASLNQVLYRWQPSIPVIGTLEANGWSFQDGQYTDPVLGVQSASGTTYVSAGPGVRVVVCDKVDFGIGSAFAITDQHWGEQTFRSEFRWRF
ncbi:MAG TPA: hypothetical protein VL096_05150 [Pirellulaceae bacterium]|nr:hypothetical protein [Pirellulaceae bacterium]